MHLKEKIKQAAATSYIFALATGRPDSDVAIIFLLRGCA